MTLRIALIAHDNKKDTVVALAREFFSFLSTCTLCATGTTGGRLVTKAGPTVERMRAGQLPWLSEQPLPGAGDSSGAGGFVRGFRRDLAQCLHKGADGLAAGDEVTLVDDGCGH